MPISNKYLRFGHKDLVFGKFLENKYGQGTQSTKMGADKLAKNTPNALKFICPIPKVEHRLPNLAF